MSNRYFLVSYKIYNSKGGYQYGDSCIETISGFITRKEFCEHVVLGSHFNPSDVVILNIFEFKSKQDFEDFKDES